MIAWILYGLLILLGLLSVTILFLKITLEFTASYAQDTPLHFSISVSLRKGRIKVDIPLNGQDEKKPKESKQVAEHDKKTIKDYIHLLQKARDFLRDAIATYRLSRPSIQSRLHLENVELMAVYGLGDAAQTGIITGTAWGLIYNLYALLGQVTTLYTHHFDLKPVFNAKGFRFSLKVALRLRLAGLIYIGVTVLVNYLRVTRARKKNKPVRA